MKLMKSIGMLAAMAWGTAAAATDVTIGAHTWTLESEGIEVVDHMGVKAFKVNGGGATLKDGTFKNGIIEFDMHLPDARGFAGVNFRERDEGRNAEQFYLRPHLPGMPDANQYQPIFNGNSAWQLLHSPRYSAATPYEFDRWTHVKLVVKDDQMDVYIDSGNPVLHVDKLMHGTTEGGVTVYGFMAEFYIANVRVTSDDTVRLQGTAAPLPEMPEGLITWFKVGTTPVDAKKVEDSPMFDRTMLDGQEWQSMKVGETGAVNLGRVAARGKDANTLLVKMNITADMAKTIKLKYGFSDRATIFLNGRAIAHENDTYMTRDYRYLGTMGLFDSVFLPLEKGDNEVIIAVSESFGGWGVMAAIEDQTGISLH
ncbi:MAG: hypothetical protein HWE25_04160 [Alphaproteobacteria bacterium]|nr:hypothetical protein [Alphaproteobacteria bacterium]